MEIAFILLKFSIKKLEKCFSALSIFIFYYNLTGEHQEYF